MIKKIVLFTSLLFINPTFCQQQEIIKRRQHPLPMKRAENPGESNLAEPIVIEDTGYYWVYVKQMPSYWTFWKCWEPFRVMATYAKASTREVLENIDSGMPILMTFNLQDAQSLQAELLPLGCEIEIHEVAFSFSSKEDAEYFKKQHAERCVQES